MRRQFWGTWARLSVMVLATTLSTTNAGRAGPTASSSEQGHDFGPVPRGVKVHHSFVLTNRLGEAITIADVRASCGCTTGRASASLVPPGGSATIEAEMDTRNFVGKKATTLFVTIFNSSGRETEVRLGVSSTILSDIVLNPGSIDFGSLTRGQTPTQILTIDRVGLSTWQISRMTSSCRAIDATLTETSRNGQSVGYQLKVSIRPDASPGSYRDAIHLVTNDTESPIVPIQVTAVIRGDLSASPTILAMGAAASTGEVQGRFLVRASRPFVVRSIEGEGDGFKAQADDAQPKTVHLVTVTYRPEEGKSRGDLRRVFRLETDLAGEPPLELTATVQVSP